jgi:hypothetical protein
MEDICLICLEPPLPNSPLLLLACGCKVSWFHESCEIRFLETCQIPIRCPVCKRMVPLDTNYSFHIRAGPIQRVFWNIILFTPFEFLIWHILPVQTVLFFCIPYMIKTEYSLDFFLLHAYIKQLIVLSTYFIDFKLQTIILFFSCFHVLLVFMAQIQAWPAGHRDPLEPFAISRQVRHAAITYSAPDSAPAPASGQTAQDASDE